MRHLSAAMLLAVLLIGCGPASTDTDVQEFAVDAESPHAAPQRSDPHELECAEDRRSTSVYDYVMEAVGASTAEDAVKELLTSEPEVRATRVEPLGSVGDDYNRPGDTYTVMGALHEDGTLRAVAYVRQSAGGGWLVDMIESCGTGE